MNDFLAAVERPRLSDYDNESSWTTKESHRYEPRQLWYPLAHVVTQWEHEFHELMLRDRIRMRAYKSAIDYVMGELVKSRRGVIRALDVGTGYGILSYWIVKSFRKHCEDLPQAQRPRLRVYAIEGNPVIAGEAHRRLYAEGLAYTGPLPRRIQCGGQTHTSQAAAHEPPIFVCQTTSYDFRNYLEQHIAVTRAFDQEVVISGGSGPESVELKADLIVSETFGALVDTEDAVAILANVIAAHLKEDGLVIPARAASYLQPVQSEGAGIHFALEKLFQGGAGVEQESSSRGEIHSINNVYIDDDLRTAEAVFDFNYDTIIPEEDALAAPQMVLEWIFALTAESSWRVAYRRTLPFEIDKAGSFVGFKGFFRMTLVEGENPICLDISSSDIKGRQTSDCWKHLYLPVKSPVAVENGDTLEVIFQRRVNPFAGRTDEANQWEPEAIYEWDVKADTRSGTYQEKRRYKTLRPFVPKSPSILRDALSHLCALVESQVHPKSLLPDTDEEAEVFIVGALLGLLCGFYSERKPVLSHFWIAWPSSSRRERFLWFEVDTRSFVSVTRLSEEEVFYRVPEFGFGVTYEVLKHGEAKVRIQSDLFDREKTVADWLEALRAMADGRGDCVFMSAFCMPQEEVLRATPSQLRELESALYLLEAEILVRLLLRDFKRYGAGLQARVVEHEIGQVSGIFRVGLSKGRNIWWYHEFDKIRTETEPAGRERLERMALESGVISLLGKSVESASNYIDLVADSKTADTPFDEWAISRLQLAELVPLLLEFSAKGAFAFWARRKRRAIGLWGSLWSVVEQQITLESDYLQSVSDPNLRRVYWRGGAEGLRLPGANADRNARIALLRLSPPERRDLVERLGQRICKLFAALMLNCLKHAWGEESFQDFHPVAISIADLGEMLRFRTVNSVRLSALRLAFGENLDRKPQQVVVDLMIDRLRDVGIDVAAGQRCVLAASDLDESKELVEFIRLGEESGAVVHEVLFRGSVVTLLRSEEDN